MTVHMPLVSFLVAAYNEEKYIVECIDSCLNQTHPNIEVCVTDDGSTDNTWNILQENYLKEPRVILDRLAQNKGKVFAYNNSYNLAKGDFFAIIGADDVSIENRIENSYNFLQKNNSDLVFGRLIYCDKSLAPLNKGQRKIGRNTIKLERIIFDNICNGGTLFINRNMAEKCFPIPETLAFEDWWIGFISLLYGKVNHLNKYLIKYRQHDDNDNLEIDDSRIVTRIKNDFIRHEEYYKCFYKEIMGNIYLDQKDKYLKLIRLNVVYRKLFLEDDLFKRVRLLPELIKNMKICVPFFASFLLMIYGNRIYNIKKTKTFKKLFYHKPDVYYLEKHFPGKEMK